MANKSVSRERSVMTKKAPEEEERPRVSGLGKVSVGGLGQPKKKLPTKKKEEEGEKGEKEKEKKEEEAPPTKKTPSPTGKIRKKYPDETVVTKKEDVSITPGYDPSLPISYSQSYVPTESGGVTAPAIGGISVTTIILLLLGIGVLFFLMKGKT